MTWDLIRGIPIDSCASRKCGTVLRLNRSVVRILTLATDRGETIGEPEFDTSLFVNRVAAAGKPVEQRPASAAAHLLDNAGLHP